MSRTMPDVDSVVGILDYVAGPIDERAEREAVKAAMLDRELDYRWVGETKDDRPLAELARQKVTGQRTSTVRVPVSYGPPAKAVHDTVQVSRLGDGLWVEGSSEAIKSMIMARNPVIQLGVSAEPVDTKVTILTEEQAARQRAALVDQWSRG